MACTLLLPTTNRHVTALRFDLMARTLLHDDLDPGAGIVLLSYRPAPLLPYVPTSLAPIRLRNDLDNPSCRYAYDPVACIVLLPEHD